MDSGRGTCIREDAEQNRRSYLTDGCRGRISRIIAGSAVSFDGTPEAITAMIRDGQSVCGDLYLD
jgi:hypothetical protein